MWRILTGKRLSDSRMIWIDPEVSGLFLTGRYHGERDLERAVRLGRYRIECPRMSG